MSDMVLVTDWDKVDKDDFYLSDEWLTDNHHVSKSEAIKLRQMAEEGKLFEAYVVGASDYAIYGQMDAHQVLIDEDGDEVLSCESAVIGCDHQEVCEYKY